MRGQAVFVQQLQDVVNNLVLGFSEEVWLREGGCRDTGAGILATELGDDVVEVLLRAQALPFEHFHNGGDLLHVGDGRLFEGRALAFGAVAHLPFGVHSRASFCASAI